jgi:hypothetical protein
MLRKRCPTRTFEESFVGVAIIPALSVGLLGTVMRWAALTRRAR